MPRYGKDKRSRAQLRAKAIKAMGGRCVRCGFSDARALQFDHIKPIRRGLTGISKKAHADMATYRAVLKGKTGIQLLCANCHAIKTRCEDDADGSLSLNWSHSERLRLHLRGDDETVEPAQMDLLL
jgi:5-methylcytosine-specific restriction endonuclease McrA